MGPLVNERAVQMMKQKVRELVGSGAELLGEESYESSLVKPVLLDMANCTGDSDEEVFGPLLKIYRCQKFDVAIDLANSTDFGLAAALISRDEALFERFKKEVRAGIINWNRQITGSFSSSPFGGVGRSGNYRPGAYFAADYCAWPSASIATGKMKFSGEVPPGIDL